MATQLKDTRHTQSLPQGSVSWPLPPTLEAYLASAPLEEVDIADPLWWETDTHWAYFKRLREEAPVFFTHVNSNRHRGFWNVTRWNDVMAVDTNHQLFSSEATLGGITLFDMDPDFIMPMFIAMDPPKHDVQRKAVNPIVSGQNLASYEALIRERTQEVLDGLPRGEAFDWVDKVSIELTSRMLATLFGWPQERRRMLTYWSDVSTADPELPGNPSKEERQAILLGMLQEFTMLWNERVNCISSTRTRPSMTSCVPTRPWSRTWCRKSFATRRRWPTCAAPPCRTRCWAAS